jgi:bifunctional non-homologous end joining protein LigD
MLKPMLASLADPPLADASLVYEPKYDGIRAIAEVPAAPADHDVLLWSRLGNEKSAQFPEIAGALAGWGRRRGEPVVLDGEIVALDEKGQPAGFQKLQGRIHLTDGSAAPTPRRSPTPKSAALSSKPSALQASQPSALQASSQPVAFIAFDILRRGRADLRERPLHERRAILEEVFLNTGSPLLRISEQVRGDGHRLYEQALERGWEGLIAKQVDSKYKSGKRTPDWRKLKIVQEQEFVVGGWTEPRQSRAYFGALLLGVYDEDDVERRARRDRRSSSPRGSSASSAASAFPGLVYVGHTGTGFNDRELARVMRLLRPIETTECPFASRPKTNERAHWVRPTLVAQVRFTEWTDDNKLRHPVYLGLRDDKTPQDVRREKKSGGAPAGSGVSPISSAAGSSSRVGSGVSRISSAPATSSRVGSGFSRISRVGSGFSRILSGPKQRLKPDATTALIEQLRAIEDGKGSGTIDLGGDELAVTNLRKIFWPKQKLTKGDLFRYYAAVAPCLLPAVADRALVMKRFPNGVDAKPFYQHRVEEAPPGVRIESVAVAETRPQIIGGSLKTLMYTTQLAAISQDPWFSRVQSPQWADHVALDLDPPDGVPFSRVLDVARWIHDELETLGAEGFPKTSGSDGLHIYIPLPPRTPYDAGLLFCQIVATVVTRKHPKEATIERAVSARGKRVYIDCLQNILGKTLATAYSARASQYAGVSTPLTWAEVHGGIRREDFTIQTIPARLAEVSDLWTGLRESKGVDLSRVARYQK